MWRRMIVLAVLQLVVVAATARTTATAGELFIPSGNPQNGRDVFVEKGCLTCHAVRGTGGRSGPDLAEAVIRKGVLAIGAGMWSHIPEMSKAMRARGESLPSLSPKDVKDLLAYLLFIGFVVEPGDASKGRILFANKGCVNCHMFGGKAGPDGPSLHDISEARTPTAVAQAMWNHTVRGAEDGASDKMAWPSFRDEQMADLIAFLVGPSSAGNLPADLPGSPSNGKVIFQSKGCTQCHFPGSDSPALGPDLSTAAWYKTSTQMAGVMWNHRPAVAAFVQDRGVAIPYLEGTEMADMVAYLYVLRSAEKVGDPDRGRAIFSSKQCAGCHADAGPGEDLKASAALTSAADFGSAMWNHAPRMQEAVESSGLEWPALTGEDIADLLAYLLGDTATSAPGGS